MVPKYACLCQDGRKICAMQNIQGSPARGHGSDQDSWRRWWMNPRCVSPFDATGTAKLLALITGSCGIALIWHTPEDLLHGNLGKRDVMNIWLSSSLFPVAGVFFPSLRQRTSCSVQLRNKVIYKGPIYACCIFVRCRPYVGTLSRRCQNIDQPRGLRGFHEAVEAICCVVCPSLLPIPTDAIEARRLVGRKLALQLLVETVAPACITTSLGEDLLLICAPSWRSHDGPIWACFERRIDNEARKAEKPT